VTLKSNGSLVCVRLHARTQDKPEVSPNLRTEVASTKEACVRRGDNRREGKLVGKTSVAEAFDLKGQLRID